MRALQDVSVRTKLTGLILLTALGTLSLGLGLLSRWESRALRRELLERATLQARLVAARAAADIASGNRQEAERDMRSLEHDPDVLLAAFYDAEGRLFAAYRRSGEAEPPGVIKASWPDAARIQGGAVELSLPVEWEGDAYGTLFVQSSLEPLAEALRARLWAALVAGLTAVSAVLLIAFPLERALCAPIRELAGLVGRVRQEGDYTLRAGRTGADEIGVLCGGVNDMLAAVAERERALQAAQDELKSLKAGLELSILERTAELESAKHDIESFAYSVSHDLRAPVRAIGGFSQILLDRHARHLSEDGKQLLRRIGSRSGEMAALIDSLLSLSRLSRQPLAQESVSLSELAQQEADRLQAAEPGRKADFSIARRLAARGDPTLLRALLSNLLDNAWKFTRGREGARIEFGRERGGARRFYVRDNGVGFDMAHARNLFKPFQRLNPKGEYPGMGIGLAMVERIVSRHGGKVQAEGSPGLGAAVYFTLTGREGPDADA